MFKVQDERSFWGSGLELAERATLCARSLNIESEKINQRLIRYYVSENIINKPDKLGKEAAYNYLHLLQLLVARRMAQGGTPLNTVRIFNQSASVPDLERALLGELSIESKNLMEKMSIDQKKLEDTREDRQKQSDYREILKIIKNLDASWTEDLNQQRQRSARELERANDARLTSKYIADRTKANMEQTEKILEELRTKILDIELHIQYRLDQIQGALQVFFLNQESANGRHISIIENSLSVHIKKLEEIVNQSRGGK